jgi:ribose transport system permease protein
MTSTAATIAANFTAPSHRGSLVRFVNNYTLPLLLVAVFAVSALSTPDFATFANVRAILINTSIVGTIAVSMTAITISGNFFSLGIASSTVLAGIIFLAVSGLTGSALAGLGAAVLISVALGVMQGLIVGAGLNPVITTLAVGSVIYGLVAITTKGAVVTAGSVDVAWLATWTFLEIPLPVYIFVLFTAVAWFLTEHTLIGRNIHLLGANRATARNSGISPQATTIWAFISFGVGLGVAGALNASQLHQMQANDLAGLTMDVIAAVLVGGTAVSGGEGSPTRSALGALLIVALGNIMLLHGLDAGWRVFLVGGIVVVLVVVLHVLRKVSTR